MSVVITQQERVLKISEISYMMDDLPYKIKDLKGIRYLNDWVGNVNTETHFENTLAILRNFDIGIEVESSSTTENNFYRNIPVNLDLGFLKVSNAGQVIGDIRFYDKVLNETNWDETITPFGYGKWKELITGDYIYQKCLCKFVLQASLNSDRPNARTYIHKIDIADTYETGIAELTEDNQPYTVEFTRPLHIVPDVNTTIKSYSGIDGTPTIIVYNITTKSFDVTMKMGSEYVAGTISWASRGF